MTIYGIKTCSTVGKARKFMKDNNIEFDFVDYKVESVNEEKISEWLKQIDMKLLFNSRSTTYRTLKLKELKLNDDSKEEWLCKENMLIKRPVVEFSGQVLVGYNEEIYKGVFL